MRRVCALGVAQRGAGMSPVCLSACRLIYRSGKQIPPACRASVIDGGAKVRAAPPTLWCYVAREALLLCYEEAGKDTRGVERYNSRQAAGDVAASPSVPDRGPFCLLKHKRCRRVLPSSLQGVQQKRA